MTARLPRDRSTGTCGPTPSPPGSRRCCGATASRSSRAPRSSSSSVEGRRLTHVRTAAGDYRGRHRRARRRRVDDTARRARSGSRLPDGGRQGLQLLRRARPSCRPTRSCSPTSTSAAPRSASRMRIGGTMEFSGLNTRLDRRRIADIVERRPGAASGPGSRPRSSSAGPGCGRSPPDGLPVLDRTGRPRQRLRRHRLRDAGRDARAVRRARRWPS